MHSGLRGQAIIPPDRLLVKRGRPDHQTTFGTQQPKLYLRRMVRAQQTSRIFIVVNLVRRSTKCCASFVVDIGNQVAAHIDLTVLIALHRVLG